MSMPWESLGEHTRRRLDPMHGEGRPGVVFSTVRSPFATCVRASRWDVEGSPGRRRRVAGRFPRSVEAGPPVRSRSSLGARVADTTRSIAGAGQSPTAEPSARFHRQHGSAREGRRFRPEARTEGACGGGSSGPGLADRRATKCHLGGLLRRADPRRHCLSNKPTLGNRQNTHPPRYAAAPRFDDQGGWSLFEMSPGK